MTSLRRQLACDIASGLAGWHQLQAVQNLGALSGEDAARLVTAQIVNAQGRYLPATSQLPPNWGSTKKRVDVALKGRNTSADGWYGAIEIKWPGDSHDPHQVRLQAVQDAMRLAFVRTSNLNAKFLVLGGSTAALRTLFDEAHPNAEDRERRRQAFCSLLSRHLEDPKGEVLHTSWRRDFLGAGERLPATVFQLFDGKLKTELLAKAEASVGGIIKGSGLVWQCNRTRGSAAGPDPA